VNKQITVDAECTAAVLTLVALYQTSNVIKRSVPASETDNPLMPTVAIRVQL